MSHRPRWYVPGTVYEVTSGTIQERYLLKPSAVARALIHGVIARALVHFETIRIHGFIFLSNHCHLLLSATNAEHIAPFLSFVFGNTARELGRLHGWRGPLWARPCSVIPILDENAQIDRLRYLLSNCVKEGLVPSPRDWPGATSTHALLTDMRVTGTWVNRDGLRRARSTWRRKTPTIEQFTSELSFELQPLPCWAHLSPNDLRERHTALVESVEHQGTFRRTLYLGVQQVLAVAALDRPEESKGGPAPCCHASNPQTVEVYRALYRGFVESFHRATRRLLVRPPSDVPKGAFVRPNWFAQGGESLDLLAWTS